MTHVLFWLGTRRPFNPIQVMPSSDNASWNLDTLCSKVRSVRFPGDLVHGMDEVSVRFPGDRAILETRLLSRQVLFWPDRFLEICLIVRRILFGTPVLTRERS